MARLIRFLMLIAIKIAAKLFYRFNITAVVSDGRTIRVDNWSAQLDSVRLILLLNHTSLFEPIHLQSFPIGFLWRFSQVAVYPGADDTLKRPVVGRFFKWLAPKAVPISRKRDETWTRFLEQIDAESIITFLPEGRMKRPNGLDRYGDPMTVKSGVVDVLDEVRTGTMAIVYSGGLHHVQSPGWRFPRLFQTIRVCFEVVELAAYLGRFSGLNPEQRILAITRDLQERRDRYCLSLEEISA